MIKNIEPLAVADASECHSDPHYNIVDLQYSQEKILAEKMEADPEVLSKLEKAVSGRVEEIKGELKSAVEKWNTGDAYGAGLAIGHVEAIVSAPWAPSLSSSELTHTKNTPGSSFLVIN